MRMMLKAAEFAKSHQWNEAAWLEDTYTRTKGVIAQATEDLCPGSPEKVASSIAPYMDVPVIPLPPQRRSEFVAHLTAVVEKSFADAPFDGPPPEPPEKDKSYEQRLAEEAPEPKILDTACIACQGDCCTQGNTNNAFLKEELINYIRWRHPEMEATDIIDMYMSYLPEKSVRDSCAYHGDKGCTLHRPIRANICNSFQCGFRKRLAKTYDQKPGHGAVVAGISKDHVEHPEAGADYLRVVSMSEQGDVHIHSELKLPEIKQSDAK